MKNKKKNSFLFLFLILLLAGFFGLYADCLADSPYLLINQIQIDGTYANEDFVELYNPTDKTINLSGFKLTKKTSSGTESTIISSSKFSGSVAPKGYFLISHQAYQDAISADLTFSGSTYYIAGNNTVILYDQGGNVLDKVGFGAVNDCEGSSTFNPQPYQSIQRKNFQDTNNNHDDFEIIENPIPKNSHFCEEGDESEDDADEDICEKTSDKVKINEIYPYTESENEEFVEFINNSENCVNLSGWKIMDNANHKYVFPENSTIQPEEIFFVQRKLYLNNDIDTVYLCNLLDDCKESVTYDSAKRNYSYSFNGKEFKWSRFSTPGEENIFKKDYPGGVYLNEILPDPEGDEEKEEFIELYNGSDENINLEDWVLKDDTKTSQYVFPKGADIGSEKYLVVYRKDFDFALNNSGDEKVYLLNPNEEIISSVSYDDSNEAVSYNFDGKNWRWSKDITPGKKNKFNKLPKIEVDIDDKFYVDIYADFKVKVNDPEKEKVKVTWDFGDGHKSYKKETRHKYEKKGKYKLSVKIFDGSEEVVKEYKIEAKKFSRKEVKIRALCPNPAGSDSENEWILVKNYSDDKINLKGWSVATGSKKLYNHPIYEDIEIKKGKTAKITREDSSFTLNNEKSKVELRYPDGKEAYEVKYDKGDDNTAEEDEIYEKTDGGWQWIKTQKNTEERKNTEILESEAKDITEENFEELMGGQSVIKEKNNKMGELINYRVKIKLASYNTGNNPRVLGTSTENYNEPIYRFAENTPSEHYAVKFFKKILININYFINKIVLDLS